MRAAIFGSLLLLIALPALAQTKAENAAKCVSDDPDIKITGCTAMIDSPDESRANWAIAYYNRGVAFSKKSLDEKAISDFSMSLALSPNDAQVLAQRGWSYQRMRQNALAIADYGKVIALDRDGYEPYWISAYANRAVLNSDAGRNDQAIADFTVVIKREPSYLAWTYFKRGIAYQRKRDYDAAIKDFSTAIDINPKMTDAYNNRGWSFNQERRYDESISDFTKAIALKPDLDSAYNSRGVAYNATKRYDEAIADFSKFIDLKPDAYYVYDNRGFAYSEREIYDKAIADFSKAIELNDGYARAHNGRAWTYHQMGEDLNGLPDAEKAVALEPKNLNFIETRAEIYERLGRRDDAVTDYRAALVFNEKHQAALDGLKRLDATP
jgi:tetratricopeptide (TPR) repeat protein